MGRWRVLHIITRLDAGGSSENTLLTVCGLDKERYEVHLAVGRTEEGLGAARARLRRAGVPLLVVPALHRDIAPAADARALLNLWRYLRRKRYDLVHTHSSKAGILGRWAARWAGVPHLVHTPHGHVFYGYFGPWMTRAMLLAERRTARVTDRIITLTERGAAEHVTLGVGPPALFRAIYSGIDLEPYRQAAAQRAAVRAELGLTGESLAVGCAARLTSIKGHCYLIDAFAQLRRRVPTATLLLMGDGELQAPLAAQSARLGLGESVRFLGWRADVPRLLGALDLFVLASLNEGMGRALLEAQAARVPVVATRVGGIPDIVVEGGTGLLVPPADAAALARACEALLTNAPRRQRFAAAAQRHAEHFSAVGMVALIDDLYQELLRRRT
ncbi:MAG: glycosyltransferase [Candidatus Tectomicrobia bacterium]|nr:glycosyltransferase [Candidatus Tectomicrobia bacterium]